MNRPFEVVSKRRRGLYGTWITEEFIQDDDGQLHKHLEFTNAGFWSLICCSRCGKFIKCTECLDTYFCRLCLEFIRIHCWCKK